MHCHGVKRSGSHSWEEDNYKVLKHKHQQINNNNNTDQNKSGFNKTHNMYVPVPNVTTEALRKENMCQPNVRNYTKLSENKFKNLYFLKQQMLFSVESHIKVSVKVNLQDFATEHIILFSLSEILNAALDRYPTFVV